MMTIIVDAFMFPDFVAVVYVLFSFFNLGHNHRPNPKPKTETRYEIQTEDRIGVFG